MFCCIATASAFRLKMQNTPPIYSPWKQSHLAARGGRIFSAYFSVDCLIYYTENVTDLYAHSQTVSLAGVKKLGDPNMQGVLVSEVMERCNLSAVSVGSLVLWPQLYLHER